MGNILKPDGSSYDNANDIVSQMLKRPVSEIAKLQLCELIVAQYSAIENLVDALHSIAPRHALLPKGRSYVADARGDSNGNGNVSVSEKR